MITGFFLSALLLFVETVFGLFPLAEPLPQGVIDFVEWLPGAGRLANVFWPMTDTFAALAGVVTFETIIFGAWAAMKIYGMVRGGK